MAGDQSPWNYERLKSLISNQIEESLTLDYKAAASLGKQNNQTTEITKDVAALANSAGGLLIYGIREKDHLPESIDPVKRQDFPKEWLEHVVQTIRPKIENLLIHPVPGPSPDSVIYVVEVPQSSTAHQSTNYRYYKRFNFESVPMQDYEIRDVMARRQHPAIDLDFHLLVESEVFDVGFAPGIEEETRESIHLCITAQNKGVRLAEFLVARVLIPIGILADHETEGREMLSVDSEEYYLCTFKNLVSDVIGSQPSGLRSLVPKYGPPRFEPVLPTLSLELDRLEMELIGFKVARKKGLSLRWETYADDAPKRAGSLGLSDIRLVGQTRDMTEDRQWGRGESSRAAELAHIATPKGPLGPLLAV